MNIDFQKNKKTFSQLQGERSKACARAFRADFNKDYPFAAFAATEIRAILPFSLRLRECFSRNSIKVEIHTTIIILQQLKKVKFFVTVLQLKN